MASNKRTSTQAGFHEGPDPGAAEAGNPQDTEVVVDTQGHTDEATVNLVLAVLLTSLLFSSDLLEIANLMLLVLSIPEPHLLDLGLALLPMR